MNRLVAPLAIALTACGSQVTQSTDHSDLTTAPGSTRYLVVFKSNTLPANAAAIINASGATLKRAVPEIGVASIKADANAAAALAKNPAIADVGEEHVYLAPETMLGDTQTDSTTEAGPTAADTLYGYQWDLRRIGAPAVWARLPLATNGNVATV